MWRLFRKSRGWIGVLAGVVALAAEAAESPFSVRPYLMDVMQIDATVAFHLPKAAEAAAAEAAKAAEAATAEEAPAAE